MPAATARFMCLNGEIVAYEDARLHAFSGVVKYGAGVFEGIRAYWSAADRELYVFRLPEHVERMRFGMRVMRFSEVYDAAYLTDCVLRMLRANDLRENVHIRVIAFLDGDDELSAAGPVGLIAGAVPRPSASSVAAGIHVRVGTWARIADNALPPRVKCTGNYVNNRAAEMEAKRDGYDGVIMLTAAGKVSEGSGACLFIVRGGALHTPDVASDILESVTRDTVIRLAPEATGGRAVVERTVDRSELYACEEAFWCGSGQEIVPILSVDRLPVGDGRVGPITRALQERYFKIVRGEAGAGRHREWLTPVWGSARGDVGAPRRIRALVPGGGVRGKAGRRRIDASERLFGTVSRAAIGRVDRLGLRAVHSASACVYDPASSLTGRSYGLPMPHRPHDLPEFANPPLVEVVLSVQFAELRLYRTVHVGLLWHQKFRHRYPSWSEHPPLPAVFETFGSQGSGEISVELIPAFGPPMPRIWLRNGEDTELIQIQSDRFIHNWRKARGEADYPRYERIRENFFLELQEFEGFLAAERLGDLQPNQCELTYVNHISLEGDDIRAHPERAIRLFSAPDPNAGLPPVEDVRAIARYVMQSADGQPLGRLIIDARLGLGGDQRPILRLDLTARGAPLTPDRDGLAAFFDSGRETIVRGFTAITTAEMHQRWRRTR